MWICSNCGSRNDADFCATCGKPKGLGASGVRPSSGYAPSRAAGSTNRLVEIAVAVLLIIGIILLLFTPLMQASAYGTSYSFNVQQLHNLMTQAKDEAKYYGSMIGTDNSEVQQAMSIINSIMFALFVILGLLYASAVIAIVNLFRKIPHLFTAARWSSLSVGLILLILLIYAKSQMQEVLSVIMGSLISYYVKLGFAGIIIGLLFIGAAMLLHAKPELVSGISVTKIGDTIGLQWRCTNPSCGHMNSNNSLFCSVCGTRKGSGTSVVPPPATWRCTNPACGHVNPDGSLFCAKCGTRKNGGTATSPSSAWRYANGHTNTEDSRFCSVCGIEKSAVVSRPRSQWRCACGRENDESQTVCAYCHRPRSGGGEGLFERNPEF